MPPIFKRESIWGTHELTNFAWAFVRQLTPVFPRKPEGDHLIFPYRLFRDDGTTVGIECELKLLGRGWERFARPIEDSVVDAADLAERSGLKLESVFVHDEYEGFIRLIFIISEGWQPPP